MRFCENRVGEVSSTNKNSFIMRIFTTLICMLTLALSASAQFVIVNSPAGIAGSKDFSAASFGRALDSIWTSDIVFINDGSANPTQGCMAATNGSELAGKIVLVDRGTCEFGLKCLNAEQGGAIAVIVFNSAPNAGTGTIVMGPGAVGAQVTVPCVMLSYEDGQAIRAEMANGPVNMTIGNVQFPNDMRLSNDRIVNMFNGVMPANQAEALGMTFTPAASVLNRGLNDATNINLQAVITHTPASGGATQVYDESGNIAFLDNDSSAIIELPVYAPAEGEGVYDVTYNVSAAVDDSPEVTGDNSVATQFVLTPNVYCKGRWDFANNRPLTTNSYTISGGGNIEFLAGFEVAEGVGYKLDSIQFLVTTNAASLGALGANTVNAFVYEWEDASGDGIVNNDELSIVGFAPVEFADTSATSEWVTAEVLDYLELEPGGYIIPDDDKKYFVGVRYEGALLVFFGFDEGYDQTVAVDNGFMTRDIELPYIGINAWANQLPDIEMGFLFTGNRSSVATALYINEFESSNNEVAPATVAVTISPNPSSSKLVVESQLTEATGGISYTIRDNAGRLVYNSSKTLNSNYDKASFDVAQYPAGQYFIVITTDNGIKAERFTVQH